MFKGMPLRDIPVVTGNILVCELDKLDDRLDDSALRRYDTGNGCIVLADGEGIECTKVSGGVQIDVPATVNLISFRLRGDSSFLNGNELTITIVGGKGATGTTKTYQNDNTDSFHPFLTPISRNTLNPADPFMQKPHDAGIYDIFHYPITTPGTSVSMITGLSGNWEVMGQL